MAEPAQTAERRTVVEDSFARLPRLDIVYKTVPANTPDFYALDMLGDILFGGPSSRLYQKLVKEKTVALQVAGGVDFRRGPALFQAFAMLKPGQDASEVEKLIYEEFERVKTDGVTPAEMQKVLIQDRLQQAESMTSTMSRARTLGQYAVYFHDPDLINTILAKYSEITPADIQRVARQYLGATRANRRFDKSKGASRAGSIKADGNPFGKAKRKSPGKGEEEIDETQREYQVFDGMRQRR